MYTYNYSAHILLENFNRTLILPGVLCHVGKFLPATTPAFDLHLSWSNQTYWLLAVSVQFYNPSLASALLISTKTVLFKDSYRRTLMMQLLLRLCVHGHLHVHACLSGHASVPSGWRGRVPIKHYIYITGTRGG